MRIRDLVWLFKGFYYRLRYPQISGGKLLKVKGRIYVEGSGEVELGEEIVLDGRFGNPIVFRTTGGGKITLEDNVFLNIGCIFSTGSGIIEIGEDCDFGPRTKVFATNHGKVESMTEKEDVMFGDNCLIGTDCTILAGSELGKNCIVGGASVVPNRKFTSNLLVAGNPAKKIKEINKVLE